MPGVDRHLIRCDCCGTEGLCVILSDMQSIQLEIRTRRHGVWHTLTLDMTVLAQFDVGQLLCTRAQGEWEEVQRD